MEIEDAIRCALDGEAVIFVGAGISFLARTKEGTAVPNGASLVDLLLKQPPGTGSKHPLSRVSNYVVKKTSVDEVYKNLKSWLTVESVDERLVQLYDLPWRRIYTTNYDNAIEKALEGKRPISKLTIDEEPTKTAPGSIIHINGFIGNVTPANLQSDLILTDYSYATSKLIESDWYRFFLKDLRAARAIVFVGYSLADLDIQRALISAEDISKKSFFFIAPDADPLEEEAISDYGTLVPGGALTLISQIQTTSSDYDRVRFSPAFIALTEVTLGNRSEDKKTNVQKLSAQLVYGRLPEQEILHKEAVFGNLPFLVTRKQDKLAIAALRKGPHRDLLYIGELASGKTASTLNVAVHFLSEGYRVFRATKGSTLVEELRKISLIGENIAIIFENYSQMRDEIREYAAKRHQQHRMIMTERAVVHELSSNFIDRTPHVGPTFEVNLNEIDREDVPAFESLVNFAGFWGDRAGASETSRQKIITDQLEKSLYKLLVEIIKSEKVQAEIKALLSPITNDRKLMKLFVASFIINVLGFYFSINDWQMVFDGQWVRQIMRKYKDQVHHFLNIQGDNIFQRTGLLSAHVLRLVSDDDIVRESLVELYERVARRDETDAEFLQLRIDLIKYRSIEPIFSDRKKQENIFRYYEEIRVFGDTRNNSDYWLQLGIAGTVHNDLERAEHAFQNAYSREKAKRYPKLRNIDNYFSRFEMRKAIDQNDPGEAFAIFVRANERLKKQIFLEENRHYPFKTGRSYADIAAKHYDKWDRTQQARFVKETSSIKEKAQEWKTSKVNFNSDVEILIRETSTLLKAIGEKTVSDK